MMQVRTRYGVCAVIVIESEASVMFSLGMLLLLGIVGEEVVLESAPEVYETLLIFNVVGATSDDAP
jgi:hypothetical protein